MQNLFTFKTISSIFDKELEGFLITKIFMKRTKVYLKKLFFTSALTGNKEWSVYKLDQGHVMEGNLQNLLFDNPFYLFYPDFYTFKTQYKVEQNINFSLSSNKILCLR